MQSHIIKPNSHIAVSIFRTEICSIPNIAIIYSSLIYH